MEPAPTEREAPAVSLDSAVGLSFDYLRQLATIAMTGVGGLVALVQFVDGDRRFFLKIMIVTSLLFLAALLAFLAQFSLVDRIRQSHALLRRAGSRPVAHDGARKLERIFEGLALWLLSIGVGMVLQALFVVGLPG